MQDESTPVAVPAAGPERHWFEQLDAGNFTIQRCAACAKHVFYPRTQCVHCGSDRLEWVRPCGRGTVYSVTIIRNKPEDGGDRNLSLIDLEEGVRMMGCVQGVHAHAVRIGMAVSARIERQDGKAIVVWDAKTQGGAP